MKFSIDLAAEAEAVAEENFVERPWVKMQELRQNSEDLMELALALDSPETEAFEHILHNIEEEQSRARRTADKENRQRKEIPDEEN